MKRTFAVIFKVTNTEEYIRKYGDDFYIGNGLLKWYIGGNKNSTVNSIIKQTKNSFSGINDGIKIKEIVDVIELEK